ncbi:MAG: tellurite resistance TerB family protein [Cocleimonas sp.]|nr:tellurite resistance TerB family protein [Cocleimonas sp.]
MDTKSFLDDLLKTGKEYASKGREIAEEKLKMPKEGDEGYDATIDGMKKGAVAVGVLALLLGTGAGRRVTGSALKIGSLAAIGGIGWKAYQNWVTQKETIDQEVEDMASNAKIIPINELGEADANERSHILLKAMIAAAKADGHINKKEVAAIDEQIEKLGLTGDVASLMQSEIAKPLDVKEIAALAENSAIAAEIYLVSAVVTDKENSMERDYLDSLAKEMKLPEGLVEQLQKVKEEDVA